MYTSGTGLGLVTTIKGVKIDTTSPAAHIAARMTKANELKAQALDGNMTSWEQLWLASGRNLPIRSPAASQPMNGSQGWPRVKPQLTIILTELEQAYARGDMKRNPVTDSYSPPATGYPQAPINLPGGGGQAPSALQIGGMNIGGGTVLASLGMIALAFLFRDRH